MNSMNGKQMTDTMPVLYILVRTDLPSMNAGKAMAQASHASNAFLHHCNTTFGRDPSTIDTDGLVAKWTGETPQGFGTVLVLGVTEAQMRSAVKVATAVGFISEVVNDPTYPYLVGKEEAKLIPESVDTHPRITLQNGQVVMHRSEDPTAYVFGDKNDPLLNAVVGRFKLHP